MQRIVKELASAVGLADAIVIIRKWGGRQLYVPTTVQHGDALALTLGLDTARKLVEWGNRMLPAARRFVQLPAERNALLDLRNAAIVEACGAGRSHESVGLEYGLTRQMVSRVVKQARERAAFAGVADAAAPTESGPRAVTGGPTCLSASQP